MSIKNGDLPAMPVSYETGMMAAYSKAESVGLSKREMFAMAAMQGLLAHESDRAPKFIAVDAVIVADELLAELERTK